MPEAVETGQTRLSGGIGVRALVSAMLVALVVAGCGRSSVGVRVAGSTSIQPVAEVLAESFVKQGGARVSIQGGGSTAGVQALRSGVADLAAVSRDLTAEEVGQGLRPHVVALDVLVIAVHPSNPVTELSVGDLSRLFAGEVNDWADLGGRPGRIHLVSREAGSGSREAFRSLVGPVSPAAIIQNSAGAIRVAVMHDPGAVGYVSLGALGLGGIKPVRVNGRLPGEAGYPLVRSLALVTMGAPAGEAARFLHFARGPEGQRLVREEGLLPVE